MAFYLVPNWFFGFSLIFEIIFGVITLAVALYSFKVYNYCMDGHCKLYGLGFLSLAFSYFSWALVSWYVPFKFNVSEEVISLENFAEIVNFGVYSHVFFFLAGLVTLTYVTFDVNGKRIYSLLLSLVLVALIFAENKIVAFYFISALLLLYIVFYYGRGYIDGQGPRNKWILTSFIFLFIGSVDFTLSAVNGIHYIVGHVLFLIGYLFILVNFVLMLKPLLRKGKKKK